MSASPREIHLERLIGTKVRDPEGRSAGAIEEIEAEPHDGEWVVTRVLTGPVGMLTRLSALGIGAWLLGLLGARKSIGGCEIAWRDLDLTDPSHPRLRCSVDQVRRASKAST
ncbi:MAG TPA: hypothetical protein VFT56_16590 [Sphingomonas sp.]|nr:hypothetical protein [Sphingomonas sp.]